MRASRAAAPWRLLCAGAKGFAGPQLHPPPSPPRPYDGVAQRLAVDGYALVDGVLEPSLCAALRADVLALLKGGHLVPNQTLFLRSGRRFALAKAGVHEAEAHALTAAAAAAAPSLMAYAADGAWLARTGLAAQSMKAQASTAGGCFALHHDTDAALDTRRLTVCTYLNPSYEEGFGGQLALYPTLGGPAVLLAPLDGREVVFAADDMPHRTLPSRSPQPRVVLTRWLFAAPPGTQQQVASRPSWPPAGPCTEALLNHPLLRKHAFKAVRAEEWVTSLTAAHAAGPALDAALSGLASDIAAIEHALESRYQGARRVIARLRDGLHAT